MGGDEGGEGERRVIWGRGAERMRVDREGKAEMRRKRGLGR